MASDSSEGGPASQHVGKHGEPSHAGHATAVAPGVAAGSAGRRSAMLAEMLAYKCLAAGRVGCLTHVRWPEPGVWLDTAPQPPRPGFWGVHAARGAQVLPWLHDELWLVELGGQVLVGETNVVAGRGRLIEPVAGYDRAGRQLFADACVSHVLGPVADAVRSVVGAAGRGAPGAGAGAGATSDPGSLAAVAEVLDNATRPPDLLGLAPERVPVPWKLLVSALRRAAECATEGNFNGVTANAQACAALLAARSPDNTVQTDDDAAFRRGRMAERAWQAAAAVEAFGLSDA